MYKAAYDPTAFGDFFEKIQSKERKKPGTMSRIVTASEFNDVSDRLIVMQNRRKPDDKEMNGPRLRRAPGGGPIPVDENGNEQKQKDEQDDRPTLKRRDL
jgi:beta-barrel assembly-enhancing protease